MKIKSLTFETNEITLFLSKQFPYAAQRFAQENLEETIPELAVEKWFKRYFPSPTNHITFNQLKLNIKSIVYA